MTSVSFCSRYWLELKRKRLPLPSPARRAQIGDHRVPPWLVICVSEAHVLRVALAPRAGKLVDHRPLTAVTPEPPRRPPRHSRDRRWRAQPTHRHRRGGNRGHSERQRQGARRRCVIRASTLQKSCWPFSPLRRAVLRRVRCATVIAGEILAKGGPCCQKSRAGSWVSKSQ